jgi:hypothetical protein
MPIARFQMPDGRVARFEVPEGTTPEQAQSLMEAHFAAPAATPATTSAPQPEKSLLGFAGNAVSSAVDQLAGLRHAISHPIDTATGLLDVAAGAAQKALPQSVVNFVNKFDSNPEAAQRAVKVAQEVGGQYAKDYGSVDAIKEKLYKDPVGVMADVSALLTGGGGALTKAGKIASKADAAVLAGLLQGEGSTAARVAEAAAPAAGKVARAGQTAQDVGAALTKAGNYTNPMAPVAAGLEKVAPAIASGAGAVRDYFDPRVKAANIARQAAGQNLEAIRAANAAAPADLTAGQAAADVIQAPYQTLAADMQQLNASGAYPKELAQQAARRETIAAVTPDLAAAEAQRAAAAEVAYGRARAADQQRLNNIAAEQANANMLAGTAGVTNMERVSPALQALKGNPIIDAAAKEARTLAASKGVKLTDPMSTLEGLHYMKVAIDNQFKNRGATTALNKYSDAALNSTKESLLAAIEGTANQPGVSPLYGLARRQHAALSEPVNQAQVLNKMQEVLTGAAGGEQANAFLNVLGKGENALLKRANQNPRFGGIEEVLTPEQMGAVKKVSGELTRETKIKEQAARGADELALIIKNNESKIKLPNVLNTKAALANKTISILEGKVNVETIEALRQAFESGKGVNELLNTVPAKDRIKILSALDKARLNLSPTKLNALGLSSNALNGDNKNALRGQ